MNETTTIEQLRIPDSLSSEGAGDFLRAVEVSRQVRLHTWGNDQLAYTAEELFAQCHDPYEWYVVLVVRSEGQIVGRAGIALPLDDNTELAHVTLDVLPEAAGHGLGRKLLEAAELFVRGENRKIVMVETNHPVAALAPVASDSEVITARRGLGTLPLTNREARFAQNAGYELDHVAEFSSCELPISDALVAELIGQAANEHGSAYRVHQWLDRCPEKWARDFVRLEAGTDSAEASEQSDWDEAKLRESEKLSQVSGRRSIVTAAECVATGTLVAFTSISILGHRPDVAFQDETVVQEEHKGKLVGLHIKVANMDLLAREFPGTKTSYTWNAPESTGMSLANKAVGYQSAGVTGLWIKDFNNI